LDHHFIVIPIDVCSMTTRIAHYNSLPSPKRQKRQAAGLVVQSFFAPGKKSTAQPRPSVHVPPRGIGPIKEPNVNDVLCGRGGRINAHEGNVQFRDIVQANKKEYLAKTTKKLEKAHIAARIVEHIRTMNPPGRFLKEDSESGMWYDIGDAKAIKKSGQALREDAPDVRTEVESGDDDDDDNENDMKKNSPTSNPKKQSSIKSGATPSSATMSKMAQSEVSQAKTRNISSSRMPVWHEMPQSANSYMYPTQVASSMENFSPFSMAGGYSIPFPQNVSDGQMLSPGYKIPRPFTNQTSGNLSKSAAEIMESQVNKAISENLNGHENSSQRTANEVAFGRHFTPTHISSGSTMSEISCISGSNLTGSITGGAQSALSVGSASFGISSQPGMSAQVSQLDSKINAALWRSSQFHTKLASRRSLDGASVGIPFPGNDAQYLALISNDKSMGDVLSEMRQPVGSMTDPIRNGMGSSVKSMHSRTSNKSTDFSIMSLGSDNSFYQSMQRSIAKSRNSFLEKPDEIWSDDRSLMSDISGQILALDLALPSHL
jgi:hypothetical protein